METPQAPKKKSRLTLFILIALVIGIVLGFVLNRTYMESVNTELETIDTTIKEIQQRKSLPGDTIALNVQLGKLSIERNAILSHRDKMVEPFSILADIFLRLIKMIVAPLVFSTLVVGVAKLGDIKAVGRIGGRTLLWFLSASFMSLLLGMVMVNLFRPGEAMHLPLPSADAASGITSAGFSLKNFLYHIFPASAVEAMAANEILQIVVFSLFFGVATAAIGESGKIIIKFFDAVAHVILKVTGYVMNVAPLAVFGAMTAIIAKQGIGILKTYSIFISEFYFSLIVLWCLLLLAGFLVIGKRIYQLIKRVKEPTLLAFSTASSEA
jgi:Na+/H+-dicarboxylate symporter